MIQDLHSHSRRSFCGKDRARDLVLAAKAGGIDTFGITDHNYGVGYGDVAKYHTEPPEAAPYEENLRCYFDRLTQLREEFAPHVRLLRGIEIATDAARPHTVLPAKVDVSFFDYCLLEHLDAPLSVTEGDLFATAKRLRVPKVGVAHTDLFAHAEKCGIPPLEYFRRMAEAGIFWEMNVSYDSIHGYREHPYMLRFFEDEREQEIVRESGVEVSIGFDGHRLEDYLPERIQNYNRRLEALSIPRPFAP